MNSTVNNLNERVKSFEIVKSFIWIYAYVDSFVLFYFILDYFLILFQFRI